jgi:hypothetical protein
MATLYVVFADADLDFVERILLPPLPAATYDRWISARHLRRAPKASTAAAMEDCGAILVVVSEAAANSPETCTEAATALNCRCPAFPIRVDETSPDRLAPGLAPLLSIAAGPELPQMLARLLPPTDPTAIARGSFDKLAATIPWDAKLFSEALSIALAANDSSRVESMIATFAGHVSRSPTRYSAEQARLDLSSLRKKRQFRFMVLYAQAALKSGVDDLQVMRQLGQALIELRDFEHATLVLENVVRLGDRDPGEAIEARGLLGRAYKQKYVDDPHAPGAPELLRRAIDTYGSVYDKDGQHFWHGVNAASLILRAARDGVDAPAAGRARVNCQRHRGRPPEEGRRRAPGRLG